jgi:hypothetical protein
VTYSGAYYPLETTGTVLRAYDIFRAYEGMEGRKIQIKIQIKKMKKIGKCYRPTK